VPPLLFSLKDKNNVQKSEIRHAVGINCISLLANSSVRWGYQIVIHPLTWGSAFGGESNPSTAAGSDFDTNFGLTSLAAPTRIIQHVEILLDRPAGRCHRFPGSKPVHDPFTSGSVN
jgi:hypothetical protein